MRQQQLIAKRLIFVALDLISLNLSFLAIFSVKSLNYLFNPDYQLLIGLLNVALLIVHIVIVERRIRPSNGHFEELLRSAKFFLILLALASVASFLYQGGNYSRLVIFGGLAIHFILSTALHQAALAGIRWWLGRTSLDDRLLVVGHGAFASRTGRAWAESYGYRPGNVDVFELAADEAGEPLKLRSPSRPPLEVLVALPLHWRDRISEVVEFGEKHGSRVFVAVDFEQLYTRSYRLLTVGNQPVLSVHNFPLDDIFNRIAKRTFDIAFSTMALLGIGWFILLLAMLVRLTSPGPAFYVPERVGAHGRMFRCYKLRTMHHEQGSGDPTRSALPDDPRVTPLGRFLRRHHLDELPQFWNVLRGDMSAVGPRPHRQWLDRQMQSELERYMLRHLYKPGITGWAQLYGEEGPNDRIEWRRHHTELDLWYLENWSLLLDVRIVLMTALGRRDRKVGQRHAVKSDEAFR